MNQSLKVLAGLYLVLFLLSCTAPKAPSNPSTKPIVLVNAHTPVAIISPVSAPSQPTPISTPAQAVTPTHTAPVYTPAPVYGEPRPSYPNASAQRHYASFYEWKQDFMGRMSAIYPAWQVNDLFADAHPNEQVVSLDGNQAEFAKMPWQYLDGAVSNSRVSEGRQKRREMLPLFDEIERRYGVPASIVTAIWGLESSFGAGMGKTDLVDALSSLAYDGRRRAFAEGELVAMLALTQRGDISKNDLKGSWAGGMGHTQFIPSTWLKQGVDGDGDGRKNPFNRADALTSTASYLANAGWVAGLPAYVEVGLPAHFDYRYLGATLPVSTWQGLGLHLFEPMNTNEQATLFLPAGIDGPKLLTSKNFEVIKVYNNSSNYALAVATLANRLNGKAGIQSAFPRHERPLSRTQVQRLQQALTALGYDTKGTDGVIGTNTRRAFASWQNANGRVSDGFISERSAATLLY